MSPPVIQVEGLSKRYIIGHQGTTQDGLRHVLEEIVRNPVRFLRRSRHIRQSNKEDFWALHDVSFTVGEGDVVGIMGRNGAGKSTLLKILSRITEPTMGRVRLRGRVASLLEVGTGFHNELTGRENIFLNGAILGMSRAEIKRKFDEIVAFSEVERFLDTPVKRYSSGMYVRLAFAVAAHLEPEILIVDEVLAVGDASFQRKCLGKMGEVSRGGRTVLFVSHNMAAIRSLCKSAVLLSQGRVEAAGTVSSICDKYMLGIQEHAPADADLRARARNGSYGTSLRILRVEMNQGRSVQHGQPFSVTITLETLTSVEDVSVNFSLTNRDGVRIYSLDSDNGGERWRFPAGTEATVIMSVPFLHLEPDTYTIDVGSRSGDMHGLDYLPQFSHVTVHPSSATPGFFSSSESSRGGVRQPAKTELALATPHSSSMSSGASHLNTSSS